MIWLALALAAWAPFAAYMVARLTKLHALKLRADASIANAQERAAGHAVAKAQAEARRAEAYLEISRNAREATQTLERQLGLFNAPHPPRTDRPALSVIEGDGPPQTPGAA